MFELVLRSGEALHRRNQRDVEAAWAALSAFGPPMEVLQYDLNGQNNWKPFAKEHFLTDAMTQRTGFVRWVTTAGMGALDTGLHGAGGTVWMRSDLGLPVQAERWASLASVAAVDEVRLAAQGAEDGVAAPCFVWWRRGGAPVDLEGGRTGSTGSGQWWMGRLPAGWKP